MDYREMWKQLKKREKYEYPIRIYSMETLRIAVLDLNGRLKALESKEPK